MPSKLRRQFTTEQKVAILRRHLAEKVPVSALCEEYKLQPSVFYLWQKQAFDSLGYAFVPVAGERMADKDRKIADLEAKLVTKDGVIAWVAEQHATPKKVLGKPEGALGAA